MPGRTPTQPRTAPEVQEGVGLREAARLRAAILRLGRGLRSVEVPGGLTPSEFSALAVVVNCGPLRPSELALREHLNPTMLSRMLSRLTSAGVVERGGDQTDGRASLVAATPQGQRLHQRLRSERARRLEAALARLEPDERSSVLRALDGLERLAELLREDVP